MILIVDDSPDNASLLSLLLARRGYPCTVVNSGRDALDVVRAQPREKPLLVILDQMMPGMSGVDVLDAIRADKKTASVPVIMYSAGLNMSAREKAMSLGVLGWLIKAEDVYITIKAIADEYEKIGGVPSAPAGSPCDALGGDSPWV